MVACVLRGPTAVAVHALIPLCPPTSPTPAHAHSGEPNRDGERAVPRWRAVSAPHQSLDTVPFPPPDYRFAFTSTLFMPRPAPRTQVSLSVVEIYCERIRDLLDASRDNLAVKSDPTRGVFIEGGWAGARPGSSGWPPGVGFIEGEPDPDGAHKAWNLGTRDGPEARNGNRCTGHKRASGILL